MCVLRLSQTVIECTLPSSLGSSFTVSIQNINNPSSTKPYSMSVTFVGSSLETVSTSLTVSTVPNVEFSSVSHDKQVGSVSANVQWFFTLGSYFDSFTILRIEYDQTIFTADFSGVATCTVIRNETNRVLLTNWTSTDTAYQLITPIKFTNPQAALQNVQITALLYFLSGTTMYSITSYYYTFSLTAASFTTLTGSSSIQLGKAAQTVSISSMVCPYTAINKNTTDLSYTVVEFSKTFLTSSTCPNGTFSDTATSKSCKYTTSASPKSINSVKSAITNQTSFSLLVTSYTYFSKTAAYYALCQGTLQVAFTTQVLSTPTFSLSSCNSGQETGNLNSATTLTMSI